jgi:hypothetical protein
VVRIHLHRGGIGGAEDSAAQSAGHRGGDGDGLETSMELDVMCHGQAKDRHTRAFE